MFVGIESPDTETLVATQKEAEHPPQHDRERPQDLCQPAMFVAAGFIRRLRQRRRAALPTAWSTAIEDAGIRDLPWRDYFTRWPTRSSSTRLTRENRMFPEDCDHEEARRERG